MTAFPSRDQFVTAVAARSTPDFRPVAVQVAERLADLQSRSLAGENVESDLRILRAATANLDDHTRSVIADQMERWTMFVLRLGLGIVLR